MFHRDHAPRRYSQLTKYAFIFITFALVQTSVGIPLERSATQDPEQSEKIPAVLTGLRVNVVEGKAMLERENADFEVASDFELQDGDVLVTDGSGRAEILLQPGNYLRLSANTRLRIVNTNYDKLRLQLESGSIAFELLKTETPRVFFDPLAFYLIRITTARSEAFLTESGNYRINVLKDDVTELMVRKGEAQLNGERVKDKRVAREVSGVTTVSEFDVKIEENFDSWCRDRANSLVQVNRQLKKDAPWVKQNKDKETEPVVDLPSEDDPGDSPYVVSAKPGKVTYVDSGVEVSNSEQWERATADSTLRSHDKLRTAPYSRVELMMFPDIFFRIDGNSEVVFDELSNDAVVIRIVRGAAILEAADFDRKRLPEFKIGSSSTSAVIVSDGNYRWDINSNIAKISARKGRLTIGGRTVDSCRRFTGGVESECEKKRSDNFDFWSEFRGEGVTGSGRSIQNRFARVRQRWLRNTGFWYRATSVGYYTFVPYSSTSYQSPYGGNYSVVLSPRRTPVTRPEQRMRPFPRAERTIVNPRP